MVSRNIHLVINLGKNEEMITIRVWKVVTFARREWVIIEMGHAEGF